MSTDNALAERNINHDLADTIGVGKGGINFDNAGQVMEYAKLMAASQSAVPKHLRGQPGACLGILDDAIRFQINPYALARKSYFVNDQLAYEAQVFMAVVNAHAPLKTRPDIRFEGEGQEKRAIVSGTFRDGAVREYKSPRIADITPKNSPLWKSDPEQQLSYYSLRGFARRWCPEVIMGIHDVDELREAAMTDITPKADEPAAVRPPRTLEDFAASAEAATATQKAENARKPAAGKSSGRKGDAPADPAHGGVAANPAPESESQKQSVAEETVDPDTGEATTDGGADIVMKHENIATDAMSWPDAIRRILAMASDPGVPQQGRLENLEQLRPAYEDALPPERLKTLFDTAKKVAVGEQKADVARKYLEAI